MVGTNFSLHVVGLDHWLEMFWFIGWKCFGSLVGNVLVHWLEMLWITA